jgi:hypothetical protein
VDELKLHSRQLKQFACRQVLNEISIGCEEIVPGEIFKLDPADLLVNLVIDLAREFIHCKELQVDGAAVSVVVPYARHRCTNQRCDSELFSKLAGERLLSAFSRFDLATRELPLQSHGLIGATLPNKNFAPTQNESGRNKT